MSRIKLAALVLFSLTASVQAQTRVLDLVPADAGGALVIRGIDELKQKGDKFIAAAKVDDLGRPSQLFDFLFANLGIQGGVHGKLPTGILLVAPQKVGFDQLTLTTLEKLLVLAVPHSDLDQLAKAFGIAPGKLKPDVMVEGKGPTFGTHFLVHGAYLYVANHAQSIRAVVDQESMLKKLDPQQVRVLGDPDMVFMLSNQGLNEFWRFLVGNLEEISDKAPAEEKQIVKELIDSFQQLRYFMLTVRIDEGLGGSLLTVFRDGKHPDVQRLLTRLRGHGHPASLAGLPEGHVLAAQALQGDGSRNTAVIKALLNVFFRHRQVQPFVNYAHRPNIVGAFTEVMHHLKDVRFAIYDNLTTADVGQLGAVAILETTDSAKFLADIKDLARFADSDNFDLTAQSGGGNVTLVRKLVADLGNSQYRLREAATVRLALIGERVLPFLEDSLASKDLEVAQRARKLQQHILTTAAERRKELLSDDVFRRIKPRLLFSSKAENWQGDDVYSAYIKLDDAAAVEPKLREVLGPEWNRVRFAMHGNRVAVLFGSNHELLRSALQNLKKNHDGLHASKAFAGFNKYSNAKRNFEIHVASQALMSLINPTPPRERQRLAEAGLVTSFSMTIGDDSIQLDMWTPPPEFAVFFKLLQS